MQVTAVITATINISRERNINIVPEIMIPLVGGVRELKLVEDIATSTTDRLTVKSGISMKYEVDTMIEIPRAALTADEIVKEADFFSFDINDPTQITFGFSHNDAGKFLDYYYESKIYELDPFAHIDQEGVGKPAEMATEKGRAANPHLRVGIYGEYDGDPTSVEFCHRTSLDYASCSPFRVPIARLAAVQAAIKGRRVATK